MIQVVEYFFLKLTFNEPGQVYGIVWLSITKSEVKAQIKELLLSERCDFDHILWMIKLNKEDNGKEIGRKMKSFWQTGRTGRRQSDKGKNEDWQ